MIGLYWGRFNPPHKGHLKIIKDILKEADQLIIAIGKSQVKNTKRNPFNGTERKKMLEEYLKEQNLDLKRIRLITIPETNSLSSSITTLFNKCGKFDILYTDKESVIRLVNKKVNVKRIRRNDETSSTKIRKAISRDEKWEHLTGKSVKELIKKFDGIERIKSTYKKKSKK